MEDIVLHFAVDGKLAAWSLYGEGHINETYILTCNTGHSYILQKISRAAFKDPEQLMSNIAGVCSYLEKRLTDRRASMHLVPTVDGRAYYTDPQGECWRMYEYVSSSICLQKAETPQELCHTAFAFGQFQRYLADFPVQSLYETIPNFHNTPLRYEALSLAISADPCGRAAKCGPEIDFALARRAQCGQIVDALGSGALPVRVTHNDTKLNNILLDYKTREPLCVIDLDTVMPGSSLYDFGDLIRFGASTAAEDERELDKVSLDLSLFEIAVGGYLDGCGGSLTRQEITLLPLGAKLMTLECGVRFLTDFLNGDVYFHTAYPEHNLVRAKTQFKLVSDMEYKWERMNALVAGFLKQGLPPGG